jgi:hypothetical protein
LIRSSIANDRSLKNLERGFIGIVIALAATSVFLLGSIGVQFFAKRNALQNVASVRSEIVTLRDTIEKAKELKHSKVKNNPTAQVQEVMDSACSTYGVTMVDFQAMGDPTPYLTRFKKSGGEGGWMQTTVTVQLKGSLERCFEVLRIVLVGDVPVEIDALEVQPSIRESKDDKPGVSMKLVFRVVKQEAAK